MPTIPLIQDCVLIALDTVAFEVTGNAAIANCLTDAPTTVYVNSGTAYVLDNEGNTYGGSGTVEPFASDRAAFDALAYQTRHANDIDQTTGIHWTKTELDSLYGGGTGTGGTPDWFNVVSYGATGNGVTDDTTAIQATINAAAAAGGGTVFFPEGIYIVGGALQDTGRSNAQLLLPIVHHENDKWIGITFQGTAYPAAGPAQFNGQAPTGGSIIRGTLSAGAGGALLGGYGPAGSFDDFTGVLVEIRDLLIELPANPQLSALNLSHVVHASIDNVIVTTGEFDVDLITQPTTTTSYGINTPNINSYDGATLHNVIVFGYYNGYSMSEHDDFDYVFAVGCQNGFVLNTQGHMAYIGKITVVWCVVGIKIASTSHFNIEQYGNERHDPTLGAKWYDRTYDVDDGSNLGYGSIRWYSTLSGTGYDAVQSFVVNGAANLVSVNAPLGWDSGVTSITAGTGLTATPNPITSTGTIALNAALNDLSDVDTTGEATGDIIYDNAGTWQPYFLGIGTNITTNAFKIRFGNVAGGNYLEIDLITGEIKQVGTSRVLKEIQVEAVRTRNGGSAPTDANRAVGASGGVLLPVKQFSKTTQNDIYFELHPGSDIDGTVPVDVHFMWLPGSGWTTGNYVWKLEYLVKGENGAAYNTGAPTTISMDVTPANATDTIETHFTNTISLDFTQTIWCHFYRDVASDNGDDTGDLRFVEMEYTANTLGETTTTVSRLLLETGDYLLLETGDRLLLE